MEIVTSAFFMCRIPKGQCLHFTLCARKVEGWYFQMLFYCRSSCDKRSKFLSLGIHAVICWPHAKSKYAYLVLQMQWVCLGKEDFCFINMRFARSRKFTSYNLLCKRQCLACFLLMDYHCLALELWTMTACSLFHLSWSL